MSRRIAIYTQTVYAVMDNHTNQVIDVTTDLDEARRLMLEEPGEDGD